MECTKQIEILICISKECKLHTPESERSINREPESLTDFQKILLIHGRFCHKTVKFQRQNSKIQRLQIRALR